MEHIIPQKLCYRCMQNAMENGVCSFCGGNADEAQAVSYALPRKTVLHGRYLVGAVLGAGGFGVTYIALDIPTGRRVAIKEFFPVVAAVRAEGETGVCSRANDAGMFSRAREQFLTEAQTIYHLRGYDGIVNVEKLFEENNTAYYCMEYLEGCDLRKRVLLAGGRLSTDETLRTMTVVLDALDYIHSRGVIHCDVSPDNIYLCSNGMIKLIDFGAAHAHLQSNDPASLTVVKHGYAPIEQYNPNWSISPRADLYACACTIYYCLTGTVPPDARQRASEDTLVPPSRLSAALSPEMESALLRGMAIYERERFSSAQEMKACLAAGIRETRPVSAGTAFGRSVLVYLRQEKARLQQTIREKAAGSGVTSLFSGETPARALGLRCVAGAYEGNVFPLTETSIRLGRDANVCEIVFPANAGGVSRIHCEIHADFRKHRVVLRDAGSRYGTQVIDGPLLREGQEKVLGIGGSFLIGRELFTVVPIQTEI